MRAFTFLMTVNTSPWKPQHPSTKFPDLKINNAQLVYQMTVFTHSQAVRLGVFSAIYLEAFTETSVRCDDRKIIPSKSQDRAAGIDSILCTPSHPSTAHLPSVHGIWRPVSLHGLL